MIKNIKNVKRSLKKSSLDADIQQADNTFSEKQIETFLKNIPEDPQERIAKIKQAIYWRLAGILLIIISIAWSAILNSVEHTAKIVEIFDGKAQIIYTVNEQEKTTVVTVPNEILNGEDQFGCPLIEEDSYIKIQDWFGHVNVYSWETGRSRFHGKDRSYWSIGRYLVQYGWIFGLGLLIMGNPYNWKNINFGQKK